MKTWQDKITVLSISKMYKDKLILTGINEQSKWTRINSISYFDLGKNNEKNGFKIFGRSLFTCWKPQDYFGDIEFRPEDCFILQEPKPTFLNEINKNDRATFMRNYIDGGVEDAFKRGRTLGLIKPLIEQVYFGWNDLFNTYESTIVFQDKSGEHYKFVCTDLKWHYSWIYLYQRQKELLFQELNQLPYKLNQKETYFVIGLSNINYEVPGGYDGRWPLILGIHSF